jgi:hypothetical protein
MLFPNTLTLRRLMKKTLVVAGMVGAFVLGMATPAFTQRGDHPRIRAAQEHLGRAREELAHAEHDFGGHRAKALEHVDRALEECHLAMEVAEDR